MATLILVRHGKTERQASSGKDFDRALTARGAADAALVGEALAARGLHPRRALVSTAMRTRQTWAALLPYLAGVAVDERQDLYDADAQAISAAVLAEGEADTILVGHNPGLQRVAASFAAQAGDAGLHARLSQGLPTGAAAAFQVEDRRIVRTLAYLTPADLGGGPTAADQD